MNSFILITGAFGFVGSNISKSLAEKSKHRLIALDVKSPKFHYYEDFITWNNLDLAGNLTVDTIVHLAGKAHDTSNSDNPAEYYEINVGLTKRIFDFFLSSDAKTFIFFSSVKAVADSVTGEWLSELCEASPMTDYGKSKLEAEGYIHNALQKWVSNKKQFSTDKTIDSDVFHQASNLGKWVYILRPAMIHGPGNKGNLNLLFKVVNNGIPWPLGAFSNSRSFTSIENVSYVVERLIYRSAYPGIYHIADDESISTNELIRLMSQSVGKKGRILNVPGLLIQALARFGDLVHLPLNSERLKKLTETYQVSNEKIKNALSITEMPVSSREGLRRTFLSFKE